MGTGPGTAIATIDIDVTPEVVYDLVTDVARMGEWSPECQGADVDPSLPLAVGATFTGRNARGDAAWTTVCTVLAADRPWCFAFRAGDPESATTWTYELRELDGGRTRLAESFDSLALRDAASGAQLAGRHAQLVDDLAATLGALKAVAERESAG